MAGGQERELRRRIRSVESTKKITRAMELIAVSPTGRAYQAITAARPYVAKIREVVAHLADSPDAAHHPLFRPIESPQRVAIVFVTADRGLAGGYNSNVIRTVERMVRAHQAAGREVQLVALGRKGVNHFRFRRQPVMFNLTGVSERPSYEDARQVVRAVIPTFEAGDLDQIELVYTRFVSIGTQSVTARQLIPLALDEESSPSEPGHKTDYEFEPEPGEILDRLLPSWLEAEMLTAMLEAAASEQAARQRAMKAATDNADELIKTYRRQMNRARQDSITTEIMEIVGGAEALRQAGLGDERGAPHEIFQPIRESA